MSYGNQAQPCYEGGFDYGNAADNGEDLGRFFAVTGYMLPTHRAIKPRDEWGTWCLCKDAGFSSVGGIRGLLGSRIARRRG